jgi:hypothetical protein
MLSARPLPATGTQRPAGWYHRAAPAGPATGRTGLKITGKGLWESLTSAAITTAMLFIIIVAGLLFSRMLVLSGLSPGWWRPSRRWPCPRSRW